MQRAGDVDELVKLLADRVEHLLVIFYRIGGLNYFKDALLSLYDLANTIRVIRALVVPKIHDFHNKIKVII